MKEITLQVTEEDEKAVQELLENRKLQRLGEENMNKILFSMNDVQACMSRNIPEGEFCSDWPHISVAKLRGLYKDKLINP